MRVAILHNYRDEQQPSMRLYAERLGSALVRRGVHVTRIRPPIIVPEAWRARSAFWNKLDSYLGRFAVYPRLVRNLKTDVVHLADHGEGHLVGSLEPSRTVVTCHDVILLVLAAGDLGRARPLPQVALQLFRMAIETMKRAASVIAISTQTKLDLVRLGGVDPEKVKIIHPGLNQLFQSDRARGEAFRRRFHLGEGALVLQIGGAFYKNVGAVVRVLHRLRADGVDVRLLRIGPKLDGSDRALADRLGVLGHVVELGRLADADVPALYNAADVLLFPSLYEGFGWPPLEAMASGTPVVCSRAGSLDEIIGDAALTSDPNDVNALAWQVGCVLTDVGLRGGLVSRGLTRAARFNWDTTAAQILDVYRDVAARAA